MANLPRLSIITPVFNGIKFIEYCIQNVIGQKCSDIEHIIVDGDSSDGTVEIIKSYADRYGHIRWVSEKDMGQSDAMNKGIAMAGGNILGFLNVDDYYESGALDFVLDKFTSLPEPSLLVGNCAVWGDGGEVLWVNKPKHLNRNKLLAADERYYPFPVNPSAYFYHKSLHDSIGLYDVTEHYVMDIDFILRAIKNSHAEYVDVQLGNYRYIEGTKTFIDSSDGKGNKRFMKLINNHINTLEFGDRLSIWSHSLFCRCFNLLQKFNIAR